MKGRAPSNARAVGRELVLGMLAVTVGTLVLSVLVLHRALRGVAVHAMKLDLERGSRACAQFAALEKRALSNRAAALVEVPWLGTTMTTPGIDAGTALEAARKLRRVSDARVLLLADARGRLLADVEHPGRSGEDLSELPGVREAIHGGHGIGIWHAAGRDVVVAVAPIVSGEEVVGLIAAGEPLDASKAGEILRVTGTDVVFLRKDEVLVASWTDPPRTAPAAPETRALRDGSTSDGTDLGVLEGPFAGSDRLSTLVPLGDGVDLVLSESVERAMDPFLDAERLLVGVGAATAILATLLSRRISARLVRPILELTAASDRLSAGDFDVRVPEAGNAELRTLAVSFNGMASGVGGLVHELERTTKGKSQFQTDVNREIRTSMTGVVGMAELLLGTKLAPEQREYARAIHASGRALLATTAAETAPVSDPSDAAPPVRPSRAGRILLVEDDPMNRLVAIGMLKTLGCETDCVEDGLQAVEACSKKEYDVVLMDCQMPVMDGYEAARGIRRREASGHRERDGKKRVRIVALTANALEGDREKCLAAGMDDHVAKPMTLEDLRAIVSGERTGSPRA